MTKIVLLRIGDTGQPLLSNVAGGVLTFPACPPDANSDETAPLFTLRFYVVSGSKICNNGKVWTNLIKHYDDTFDRHDFHSTDINASVYQDVNVDIDIYKPGSYSYYITYNELKDNEEEAKHQTEVYNFVVPPSLFINDHYLTFNSVTMQTVVSKWVGNDMEKDWYPLFENTKNKGYNMIHFTPLQKRGESNSPYSLYDQLSFDKKIFPNGEKDISDMVTTLEKKYGILSMTDIVYNHTANNSEWIRQYPDVGYNAETAPHLISAMELDSLLLRFSCNMKQHGYSTIIHNVDELNKIMDGIKIHVLGQLKLWQFYIVNVQEMIDKLAEFWEGKDKDTFETVDVPYDVVSNLPKLAAYVRDACKTKDFEILGRRYENKFDIPKFANLLASIYGSQTDFESGIRGNAQRILDETNLSLYSAYDADNETICTQLFNRIKYLRLDSNGPQLGEVRYESPLTEPYFTRFDDDKGNHWQLANNGWIWGGNPLVDFAGAQSKAYLRREVIVWGDCVKLRYGSKPEDSPHLWARMIEYSKLSAKLFHGFRIDNCHSTPLHVGTAMLDAARSVNPNLYVVAELFSGSEEYDIMYVQQLGISSLIREAMQAHSIGELSRLCHKHGGRPIGSFRWLPLDTIAFPAHPTEFKKRCCEDIKSKSEIPIPELVTSQEPHALFMDCTHDNETPAQKRTVEDTLPTAALVAFCSCANGTTMGFDECYPKLLDVVNEKRKYTYGMDFGISKVKKILSDMRHEIANQSIEDSERNEMYVHHESEFITIHRLNASSGRGYLLVARTKFYQDGEQDLTPIVMHGVKATPVFSNALINKSDGTEEKDDGYLHPINTELVDLDELTCEFDIDTNTTTISIPKYFPQGSVAVVATETIGCNEELDAFVRTGAIEAAKDLTLTDINAILYRCEAEERDATSNHSGTYNVPNYGNLVYAGIQGWVSVLRDMMERNDLAHPLAEHLRNGKWALDYVTERLRPYETNENSIHEFRMWLESRFNRVKDIPNFLVPRFFALVVGVAYEALRYTALKQMSKAIQHSTVFIQSLAMVSIQMVGLMNTASIHPFKKLPSLAAGLPHFSFDFMRCWGRDVFISGRGLLLATGRYEDAKNHILCFAKTLKHGLIPNLLGSGKEPRYNARDAVWFFLQFIQDYVKIVPNGEEILKEKVKRRFPLDDTWIPFDDERAFTEESTIEEIITEILSRHAKGIKFREANAGTQIDSQMKDEGFNVEVTVDWNNGLIFGGNEWNCGTWMDKMGESVRAGNKGYPGTPRNGAAIEINGLLKSTLRFVIELNKKGLFQGTSVVNQHGDEISYTQWDQLLLDNFERCYYIPVDWSNDDKYEINSSIVNRRGIYKDLYGSHKEYEDYQLRGNFPIAYNAAPELFNRKHALHAIEMTDFVLGGTVGLRTLDPSDHEYRPYYHNGIDNDDFATAKGRNYHQGPEWLWIYGYYIRAFAKLHFAEIDRCSIDRCVPSDYLQQLVWRRLHQHKRWIYHSDWSGLTELTNKDGAFCQDSCPTQAWSAACLLDFYLDAWTEYELGEYRPSKA
jgi:glycogen debranching enzyme